MRRLMLTFCSEDTEGRSQAGVFLQLVRQGLRSQQIAKLYSIIWLRVKHSRVFLQATWAHEEGASPMGLNVGARETQQKVLSQGNVLGYEIYLGNPPIHLMKVIVFRSLSLPLRKCPWIPYSVLQSSHFQQLSDVFLIPVVSLPCFLCLWR